MLAIQLPGIDTFSSESELTKALKDSGHFRYDSEYPKDWHFKRFVLLPALSSMDDVQALLDRLDGGVKDRCHKAYSARYSMAAIHSGISDIDWAIICLGRARRTCCSCHELCSFKPLVTDPRSESSQGLPARAVQVERLMIVPKSSSFTTTRK